MSTGKGRGGDYRAVMRRNLRALMAARKTARRNLKATYLDGSKKGLRVAVRSLGNMLTTNPDASAPSLDTLAAVAVGLGVEPWMLLVPDLDPHRLPTIIAGESERREYEAFLALRDQLLNQSRDVAATLLDDVKRGVDYRRNLKDPLGDGEGQDDGEGRNKSNRRDVYSPGEGAAHGGSDIPPPRRRGQ